jgi:hypothetical protein
MTHTAEVSYFNLIKYELLNPVDYFAIADKFVTLQKKFVVSTLFEKIILWVDMIIYPIFLLWWNPLSVMTGFAIYKALRVWIEWYSFRNYAGLIRQWVDIVRSYGGPFISTNDPNYHVFVYADGMQRLSGLLLAEKSAKSL